jgi:hypothetical protein
MKSGSISKLAAKAALFGVVLLAAGSIALACSSGDDDDATPTATVAAATTTASSGSSGVTGASGTSGATGSTGAATDPEAYIRGFIDSYNNQDADAFFGAMTDDAAKQFLDFQGLDTTDLNAAKQEAAPFIGLDQLDLQKVDVTDESDDAASATLTVNSSGILEGDKIELTKDGGNWTVSSLELFGASPDVPDGYTTYDMSLAEFSFNLDGDVAAGKDAFALKNDGKQPHEAILAKLDPNVDLQQALQSPDQPEGVEVVGGVPDVEPGETYNLIFSEPLEPGRYAFVCFLPDLDEGPDGTPHAFKGMTHEFTVK